jgi:hypothetical protein
VKVFACVSRLKAATFNCQLNTTVPRNQSTALVTLQFVFFGEEKMPVVEMVRSNMRRNASFWWK